jgi:hypothetical protein
MSCDESLKNREKIDIRYLALSGRTPKAEAAQNQHILRFRVKTERWQRFNMNGDAILMFNTGRRMAPLGLLRRICQYAVCLNIS